LSKKRSDRKSNNSWGGDKAQVKIELRKRELWQRG